MVKYITLFISFFISTNIVAQIALLDEIKLLENNRNQQLLGNLSDSNRGHSISFFTRSTSLLHYLNDTISPERFKKLRIQNFQITDTRQFNDHMPSGFNDGNMYPAVGKQERISVGVNIRWRALDINLQPEWIDAVNEPQDLDKGNQADRNWWPRYYLITANNIDHFRRFGNKPIQEFFLGQSRIGLSYPKFSFGVSTENIWWGPAKMNSLMFTNNAPGFKHVYLKTNKPLTTPIGNFELKTIIGVLDSTRFINPDDSIMRTVWVGGIFPKKTANRNISAYIISWQPKWLQNFYLGYAYSTINYSAKDAKFDEQGEKMSIGVLMGRFMMPKDHAEFYVELGTPNQAPLPWKFFNDSAKTAFTIGARKIFPNLERKSFLEFFIEVTQLQLLDPRKVFTPGAPFDGPQYNSWYTSSNIKQGYTTNAQLLGASIGPGSNTQSIGLSWNKGLNKIGAHLQRLVHNNDFYNYAYLSSVGYGKSNAYWVDLLAGIEVQLHPQKNTLIAASFLNTQSMNWRWLRIEDGVSYWSDPTTKTPDKYNFQLNISVKFFFNGTR